MREPTEERLVARRDKLRTEEGQALEGRCNHTVEPVFGIIKAALGFRGFSLRGKENVSGEWTLGCLSYNPKPFHRKMGSAKNGADGRGIAVRGQAPLSNFASSGWLGRIIPTISRWLHRLTAESTAKLVRTRQAPGRAGFFPREQSRILPSL